MRFAAGVLTLATLALPLGCGDEVTFTDEGGGGSGASGSGASGSGASGSGAGGSGTGAVGNAGGTGNAGGSGAGASSGDCNGDQDCPGSECVEITPGGYRVCKEIHPEAMACTGQGVDECCTTADCAQGLCLTAPLVPYCGGPQPLEYNVCAVDQCQSDSECVSFGGICAPAGTLGRKVAACAPASCFTDAECNAEPGGICAPVTDPCCGAPSFLLCVYPNGGCRDFSDCGQDQYCGVTGDGRAECMDGFVNCPA